jgi:membrane-bound serine protease (ClpP class)
MAITLSRFAALSPEDTILLLTAGLFLLYLEFNRPGWIVPLAVGLTAELFALASLLRLRPDITTLALLGGGALLLLLDLWRRTPVLLGVVATLALMLGFGRLGRGDGLLLGEGVAIGCGAIIGAGTSILTRIARRARTNKGLD